MLRRVDRSLTETTRDCQVIPRDPYRENEEIAMRFAGKADGWHRLLPLLPILLAANAGCADKHWTKAGATEADFNRDSYECARESAGWETTFDPFAGYSYGVRVNKDLYRPCMANRGYSRTEGGKWVGPRD
jgi:hypothetical protein